MPTPRANKEFLKALEADCIYFLSLMKTWREQSETTTWSQELKDAIIELRLSAKLVKL